MARRIKAKVELSLAGNAIKGFPNSVNTWITRYLSFLTILVSLAKTSNRSHIMDTDTVMKTHDFTRNYHSYFVCKMD